MSIRATFLGAFAGLFLLLAALAGLTHLSLRDQRGLSEAQDQRYASYRLADELRQSSDDLTRLARTYVVTGDERFERYYNDVLDIRNGKAPLPAGCDGIYWDFVCATHQRAAETGSAQALQERMRIAGFTEAEFGLLAEAQASSDALVQLEVEAMGAIRTLLQSSGGTLPIGAPEAAHARELMHGAAYHEAKAKIMKPIQEFFDSLDRRTRARVSALRERADAYGRWSVAVALAAVLFTLGALLLLRHRIVRPVRALSERMQDIAEGERDLTQRVSAGATGEIGDLSRAFNHFVASIHATIVQVRHAAGGAAGSTGHMSSSVERQRAAAAGLGEAASRIGAAISQISAAATQLAVTMGGVSEGAQASAAAAADGIERLGRMKGGMGRLLSSTEQVAQRLEEIRTRTQAIGGVVVAMTKVADRTNLLSVNAAIEAQKAGDRGLGFHVVAREIRKLADETAASTLEIEASIQAMQAAVAAGTQEMGRFGRDVRSGTEEVSVIATHVGRVIGNVEQLTRSFREVHEGMSQQAGGVGEIQASMASLRAGVQESNEAVSELAGAGDALRRMVESLDAEVGRFRLE